MDASVFPTTAVDTAPGNADGQGSLADYLGVPAGTGTYSTSALPFRAYALIFNEWFRDQDLIAEMALSKASGVDATTSHSLRRICWEKDYLTSARPWVSKGPAVTLPLGTSAPIVGAGSLAGQNIELRTGASGGGGTLLQMESAGTGANAALEADLGGGVQDVHDWRPAISASSIAALLTADLSSATAVQINQLRLAVALQRYQENAARYGSRYTEYLARLGVNSPDARLQRPELLGSGRQTIQFSEVLQTATGGGGVGSMFGHGIAAMRSNSFKRFFTEHGYIVSLLGVRPQTVYMQGLFRTWNRRTKEDFWQPELQHIGQQEVYEREVKASTGTGGTIFGYQDRYDEYRRQESSVSGEFRSTLNTWHMARDLSGVPVLNDAFVECNPTNRIYQSTTTDQIYIEAQHNFRASRLLSSSGRSFIL